MLLRSLAGCKKAYGSNHRSTLQAVTNLGVVYLGLGRLPEAEALCRQALEGFENLYGPDHEDTRKAARNLSACQSRARLSETEAVPQTVLEGVDNALGSNLASSSELGSATNGRAGPDQVLLPETELERNKFFWSKKAEKRTKNLAILIGKVFKGSSSRAGAKEESN